MGARTSPKPPWSERRHREERARQREHPFQVDRDRVIHSATFRELQHKTQVQSVSDGGGAPELRIRLRRDRGTGFRTRLNHVLEVAQIARGLADDLDAEEPLAEAIALAHDLGHTPFGHAGERALSEALKAHGVAEGFNANVHSLAVVDEVECAFPEFRGLNLTWATREGIARHATPFDEPISFGEFAKEPNAGLEAQLVDMADMLAYLAHDLDDAIAAGLMKLDELTALSPVLAELVSFDPKTMVWPPEERDLLMRKRLVARLTSRLIEDIVVCTKERLSKKGIDDPAAVRSCRERVVTQSDANAKLTRDLLGLLSKRYYRSREVAESDSEAATAITGLFEALVADPSRIPARFNGRSELMRAATYVASLNDVSARVLAQKLGAIESDGSPAMTAPS